MSKQFEDQKAGSTKAKGFLLFSPEYLQKSTVISGILRKMRRSYMSVFDSKYISESIKENRTGECHRCGACCELVYRCPFLGKDSENMPYCRVYGDLRPSSCKNYPFDAVDDEVAQCGYKFKE